MDMPNASLKKILLVLLLPIAMSGNAYAASVQAPVDLGSLADFAILSSSGITDVPDSEVIGDVGTSPITGAALLLTCAEVEGRIFTVNDAGPPCAINAPALLTTAVNDMGAAYTDAANRISPDSVELAGGELGGLIFEPGLHRWSSVVTISSDVTLEGGPNDVWIFQIAGTMNLATSKNVILVGGALAQNIFWQVAGAVTLGTYSHIEGVILAKTNIAMKTGATINGKLFAQTAVTLEKNKVTGSPAATACSPPILLGSR
jgi:hypothetical protein